MERYHDTDWGFPCPDDTTAFELLTLESFQSGLSWRTILHKRDAFREAFAGFDVDAVAHFDADDVARLLEDRAIVRNRSKIEAAVVNARATVQLHSAGDSLRGLLRAHAPPERRHAPVSWSDWLGTTPEAVALARELKRRGFRFLGPSTVYSFMQACGGVNDHLASCPTRPAAERARRAAGYH